MLEQSLEKWEITASQFRLLDFLDSEQRLLRPKDLAKLLEIDVAASTRLIDRLVQKEMVIRRRCTEDKRICFITLSSGFKKEFKEIKDHLFRVENFFLEGVSDQNRNSFKEAISELSKLKKYRSGDVGLSVVI